MKTFKLKEEFADDRGKLSSIIVGEDSWKEINFMETQKDAVRGNHYHKITKEFFFILKGAAEFKVKDVKTGKEESTIVRKGDGIIIEPYQYHTVIALEDSEWIAGLTVPYDHNNPDMHRLDE